MKKLLFCLTCISIAISFSSCGRAAKRAELERQKDSIQLIIDDEQRKYEAIYNYLDSLYFNDRVIYGIVHDLEVDEAKSLEADIKKQQEKIRQIDLELK